MNSMKLKVYNSLPIFLKSTSISTMQGLDKLKFKKWVNSAFAELMETQWLSYNELLDLQFQRLRKLLIYADENVPYYNKLFERFGIIPKNMDDFMFMRKIPFFTKDIIRENFDELLAINTPRRQMFHSHTSGTTGEKVVNILENVARETREASND